MMNALFCLFEKNQVNFPMCNKGIELLENDINSESINHAIFQVLFGVPNNTINEIASNIKSGGIGDEVQVHITVPVVVTTAELYLLNKGISIESIKKSSKTDMILTKVNSIEYQLNPPLHLKEYSRFLIMKYQKNLPEKLYECLIHDTEYIPSRVYLFNYNNLTSELKKLLRSYKSICNAAVEKYIKVTPP
ncbi:MAG: hypothetical protein HZB92_05305 [Euryarchaeota archaeon]|nr:hypothetical protein [Euryarchaeota archaeon]